MEFANLRQFLSFAVENFGIQIFETEEFINYVHGALDESGKWHKRNCPLKADFMVRFVFLLILFRCLSIVNVLKMLLQQLRTGAPSLSLSAVTPEALCHARKRLGVEPLRIFFEKQAAEIQPSALFHGLRVRGVDGTKINVPDTPKNETYFGRPKASRGRVAHPQMEAVMLVETSTRQVSAVHFTPGGSSERDGLMKLLDGLVANDLTLMDRGFSAVWLFKEFLSRSKHFLARISSSWKPKVIKKLGGGDYLVTLTGRVRNGMQKGKKTRVKLTLRMIEYKIGKNEIVRLLTDLLDPKKYPALELATLYHGRWECEIAYDELKNHLSTTAAGAQDLLFRSKSPDGVLQEAYALVALYNIIRGLMAEAGKIYDINPLDISFVETVQVMKDTTHRIQAAKTERRRIQIYCQMLKDIAECRNRRPRRNRRYPRVVKKKMSNYRLKRKDCRQEFTNIERDMKLVE